MNQLIHSYNVATAGKVGAQTPAALNEISEKCGAKQLSEHNTFQCQVALWIVIEVLIHHSFGSLFNYYPFLPALMEEGYTSEVREYEPAQTEDNGKPPVDLIGHRTRLRVSRHLRGAI